MADVSVHMNEVGREQTPASVISSAQDTTVVDASPTAAAAASAGLYRALVVLSRGFQEFSKQALKTLYRVISTSFEMIDHVIELVRTKKGRRQLRAALRRWSIALGLLEPASKTATSGAGASEEVIVITKTITSADGRVVTIEERKHMRGGQPVLALPAPVAASASAAAAGSAGAAVPSAAATSLLEAELQRLRDQLARLSQAAAAGGAAAAAAAAAATGSAAATNSGNSSAAPTAAAADEKRATAKTNDENAPPVPAAKRGGPPPPPAPVFTAPASKDMLRRTPMGAPPLSTSLLNQSLEQSLMSTRSVLREVRNKSPGGTPMRDKPGPDDMIAAALKEKFRSLRRQSAGAASSADDDDERRDALWA